MNNSLDWLNRLQNKKNELDKISPTICAAKWLQVTLHLQNGLTHSCHHPAPHKVPLKELENNPDALHNTKHKITQRQLMIQGQRPAECEHCWIAEDSSPSSFSDRVIKSSDDWSQVDFENIYQQKNPSPTYLEVSFSNVCNLKCIYCSPDVSSAIWSEFERYGGYPIPGSPDLNWYKENQREPYKNESDNPYIKSFDEWFPKIFNNLKVLRITGGEPLLSERTMKTIHFIGEKGNGKLKFDINSNLMVSRKSLNNYVKELDGLLVNDKIREVRFYTSVDTHGEQANWIRFGLNYDKLIENIDFILSSSENIKLTIISTFNIFSFPNFTSLLKDVIQLKKKHIKTIEPEPRLMIDITFIRQPNFLSPNIAPYYLKSFVKNSLNLMSECSETDERIWGFNSYEINKMQRLVDMVLTEPSLEFNQEINNIKKNLGIFIKEYDRRKRLNVKKIFPEMVPFLNEIIPL